jgi:glycosyltransferase involved in cell wall biosynthesis
MKILFVTNMYPHDQDPGYGSFIMQQAHAVRRMGNYVEVFHFPGYRSKLLYASAALHVFRLTLSGSYDIVHAHYGLSAIPALFRYRTPLVITLHGSDALVGRVQPAISRIVCRYADAVIAVSEKIASLIPAIVIPCGVDLDVFKPLGRTMARTRLGLPPDKRLVLFPFDPSRRVKRYDLADKAVRTLIQRGHDVELLVVSGVSSNEMPWYYSAADVLLLCSESEGSPTSVKEALACNLPVVSTDVGDIRDILQGCPSSRISPAEPSALSDNLEGLFAHLYRNPVDTRSSMDRYSQQRVAQSILSVYQVALSKSNHGKRRKLRTSILA